MTDTRRALLQGLAAAPITGAAVALAPAQAEAAPELDGLDTDALLLHASERCADGAFARLCAEALLARMRSDAAAKLADDAEEAAGAMAGPYPAALIYTVRYRPAEGEPETSEHRWTEADKGGWTLWNLAHREAKRRGVPYSRAIEVDLRAQRTAWCAGWQAANAHYLTRELDEASCAAGHMACRALEAVLAHMPTAGAVFLLQMHLRRAESLFPDSDHEWRAFVAQAQRALT